MSLKNITLFVIIIITCFSMSCTKDLGNQVVEIFDPEFLVALHEKLSPTAHELSLDIQSIVSFDCENHGIEHSVSKNGQSIIVDLKNYEIPSDCITGYAPAQEKIQLGQLADGKYQIQINLQNAIINKGELNVKSDEYILSISNPSAIAINSPALNKVPAQCVWGYVSYNNLYEDDISEEFLSAITPFISEAPNLKEGKYTPFTIGENREINFENIQGVFQKRFIYTYDDNDIQSIKNIIAVFRNNAPNGLKYHLMTDEGEVL